MIRAQTMAARQVRMPTGLLLGLLLCVSGVSFTYAARIYKSIDAEGNVTYSSIPPPDAMQIEKIHIPSNFAVDSASGESSTLDDIKAAGEQLESDRKQREKEREEARKKLAEKETQQPEQPPPREIHYWPAYPPYYYPPVRPRPPRPPYPYPPPPRPPRPVPSPQIPPR